MKNTVTGGRKNSQESVNKKNNKVNNSVQRGK